MTTTTGRIPRAAPGGTALPDRRFPFAAVAIGGGVLIAVFVALALRGGKKIEAAPVAAATVENAPEAAASPPVARRVLQRNPSPPVAAQATAIAPAPDPGAAQRDLEATLRQQRLWGRVEIAGARVDVRSGSCGDRAMRPVIEGKASLLRGAGLTKLRCLEQSGAVVFERDL